MPCSPGRKSALPQLKPTTPNTPIAIPSQRSRPSLSPSHSQASSAVQIGAVALNTAISAVLKTSAATRNSTKGSAEFTMPTTAITRQC